MYKKLLEYFEAAMNPGPDFIEETSDDPSIKRQINSIASLERDLKSESTKETLGKLIVEYAELERMIVGTITKQNRAQVIHDPDFINLMTTIQSGRKKVTNELMASHEISSITFSNKTVAGWKTNHQGILKKRNYFLENTLVSRNSTGNQLPARDYVEKLESPENTQEAEQQLETTQLITNLPKLFYEKYLEIQNSDLPFNFPKIQEDKNKTVRDVLAAHPTAFKEGGDFHPSKWKELGWKSPADYEKWLDTLVLFAFSGSLHYCSAERIFDCTTPVGAAMDSFHLITADQERKKTNILSVTGFEYRHFSGKVDEKHLSQVSSHSAITMQGILQAANQTGTTDIVLIPYGMGVFIKGQPKEADIKEAIFAGMLEALRGYDGPPVTLHYCGPKNYFDKLKAENPKIILENHIGQDAYTWANRIEDTPGRKSMLVNAADDDWKVLLDKRMKPGQFSDGHTLYNATSDEYYALVTNLRFHSIQNLIKYDNIKDHIMVNTALTNSQKAILRMNELLARIRKDVQYGKISDQETGTMREMRKVYERVAAGSLNAVQGFEQFKNLAHNALQRHKGKNDITTEARAYYELAANTNLDIPVIDYHLADINSKEIKTTLQHYLGIGKSASFFRGPIHYRDEARALLDALDENDIGTVLMQVRDTYQKLSLSTTENSFSQHKDSHFKKVLEYLIERGKDVDSEFRSEIEIGSEFDQSEDDSLLYKH